MYLLVTKLGIALSLYYVALSIKKKCKYLPYDL